MLTLVQCTARPQCLQRWQASQISQAASPRVSARHCPGRSARQQPACASASAADAATSSTGGASPFNRPVDCSWQWRGHRIHYVTAGREGPPVVLVHGFGASGQHWRRNIPALVEAGYTVYAVDLLGQGKSEKALISYTIEYWSEQIAEFLAEVVGQPAVLVGNSVGSLAALTAAATAAQPMVKGLVLLNCAGGMNNKAIADDWRIMLAMPIFQLIDWILLQPNLARYFFDRVRQRENLRNVLLNVYRNQESVDNELVDLIYLPSNDEGALEAFVKILTGPPGPRPEQLMPQLKCPLLVLWGTEDTFTPADGPVGRFFQGLPAQRPNTTFEWLEDTGHCPHDDRPEVVHAHLLPWLSRLLGVGAAAA